MLCASSAPTSSFSIELTSRVLKNAPCGWSLPNRQRTRNRAHEVVCCTRAADTCSENFVATDRSTTYITETDARRRRTLVKQNEIIIEEQAVQSGNTAGEIKEG